MNRRSVVFLVKFAAVMIALYVIIAVRPVNDHVIDPFTASLTWCAARIFVVFGGQATLTGTVIRTPTFAVDIKNGCNGIEALILLVAGMLAFPATAGARIAGIIGGFAIVETVNVFRIAILVWIGAHYRSLFDLFHVAVWQTLIILLSVAVFVFWSRRFAAQPAAGSR